MTSDNRRRNAELELARAVEVSEEVEVLLTARKWTGAVARTYYAMFHLARALLFALGLEATTHAGVAHLLNVHLVRAGRFPAAQVRALRQLQRLREDADYDPAMVFDEAAALDSRAWLVDFRGQAEALVEELLA